MQAEVHILYKSGSYQIRDFRCECMECATSAVEQCKHFSICFVRSGFYEQQVFRRRQEVHIGRLLVSKPDIEYVIRHINNQPDLCTSFNFSDDFYERVKDHFGAEAKWFFSNPDLQSLLLSSNAGIEFIHQRILSKVHTAMSLELDDLVISLVEKIMMTMGNKEALPLADSLKRHHLSTVEKARDYLFEHFEKNISMQELSEHCCISLFHFGRIFKGIMNKSPHQYLAELRLNHAHVQLATTDLPVTQIAFQSGFNSLEHFATSYKQHFHLSPGTYRKRMDAASPEFGVLKRSS